MADTKISALNATAPLDGSEVAPLVQSSTTKKVTVKDLAKFGYQDIETDSNASKTLSLTDLGSWVRYTGAGAANYTVPTNAAVPYLVGNSMNGVQAAAGQITFVAASGVTINKPTGYNAKTRAQGSPWSLIKVATDAWDLIGDLEATV